MAKKKGERRDAPARKPKALRKQLRKAESDVGKAVAKRDRAQARLDAMNIIADELRAQIADLEKAAEAATAAKAAGDGAGPAPPRRAPARKSSASAAGKAPAASNRPAAAAKPKPAARPTAAKPKPAAAASLRTRSTRSSRRKPPAS